MKIGEGPVAVDGNDWGRWTAHALRRVVASHQSQRQKIEILDLTRFGLSLWIDGWPQFSELDEHRYHQLLVFPALARYPQPRSVLILGGGDFLAPLDKVFSNGA